MLKPARLNRNSRNRQLYEMAVGQIHWVETTAERYPHDQRTWNTPKSRRPLCMAGMEFTSRLYTAVGAGSVTDVRYLLAIERTK